MTNVTRASTTVKHLTTPRIGRDRPIGDIMREAQQRLVAHLDRALRAAGCSDLRSAHASVLASIDTDGTRLATLVDRGGRTKQATAQLAGHLVACGYAELRPDPNDRRAKLYVPTVRGMDVLVTCGRIVDDYESWLDAAVGSDAVSQLRAILLAIVEHED